ncbi:MAG: hypothetical protein AAGH99_08530 [Planctomycetota bacterium]
MNPSKTPLRELIEAKIDEQWITWSHRHPNLAEAIDRTRLIDITVNRLRDDPAYLDAIHKMNQDEFRQNQAAEIIELAELWTRKVLFD